MLNGERPQWLGTASSFRLADLGPDWSLVDLIRVAWPDVPEAVLDTHRVVLGVDAPFGFPLGFKRLLDTGEAPRFSPGVAEIDNPLAYRECDRHIYRKLGKKPLSASFDKLGNNATVAMHHVRRLARLHGAGVMPFDPPSADGHAIIEVYPALSKLPKQDCCEPRLQALLPSDAVAGTDACDGCISAIVALAFGRDGHTAMLPKVVDPSGVSEAALQVEGWIYYPSWP